MKNHRLARLISILFLCSILGKQRLLAGDLPLILHIEPMHYDAKVGDKVVWYVTASGAGPLEFSWEHNGFEVKGAHSKSLVIAAVKKSDKGTYLCHVKNRFGKIKSAPLQLTVNASTSMSLKSIPRKQPVSGFGGIR